MSLTPKQTEAKAQQFIKDLVNGTGTKVDPALMALAVSDMTSDPKRAYNIVSAVGAALGLRMEPVAALAGSIAKFNNPLEDDDRCARIILKLWVEKFLVESGFGGE